MRISKGWNLKSSSRSEIGAKMLLSCAAAGAIAIAIDANDAHSSARLHRACDFMQGLLPARREHSIPFRIISWRCPLSHGLPRRDPAADLAAAGA